MHVSSLYVEKLSYRARSSARIQDPFRIQDLSFHLEQGQCLILTGANGSGKSTTLHILAGLIRPCQGRVLLKGLDIHRFGALAKQHLGLLPEKLPLYTALNIRDYLVFISTLRGIPKSLQKETVDQALEDLRLQSYASVPIGQLSRGLKQRVGIAQAILHRPSVLLLDEPTNGLDPSELYHFQSLLERLKPKTTLVIATHYLNEVQTIGDQRLSLSPEGVHHDLHPCTS